MTIFGYVLRKPWTKYVDVDIEDEVYEELKTAVCKNITAHLVLYSLDQDLCDSECEVLAYLKEVAKDK